MRLLMITVSLVAVAACSPRIPDSAAGVGFDNYNTYQPNQAAAPATTSAVPPAGAVSTETTTTAAGAPLSAINEQESLAAEATAALQASSANSGQQPLDASPSNPAPQTISNASGISTENDFDAVGSVRSIESDAALIERNKAQRVEVAPTALPQRTGDSAPNIVSYALATSHPVGTKVYNRIGINKGGRYERNCAKYGSADRAQQDFLSKGGPERDRLGLDPDGDGYACRWNPTAYRNAVKG